MSTVRQPATGFAEVNGARLYYEVAGAGHPLILIHAGIAHSRMWDEHVDAFAQRYQVVRYDLRGFGQSAMPPGPYAHRDDLYGLLALLEIERAALVGVSMGGGIAIDFALEHPERVTALVPVASGVSGSKPPDALIQSWSEIEAMAEGGDVAGAVELELRLWVDGPGRTPEQVAPAVRERVRIMETENAAQQEGQEGTSQPLEPPAIDRLGEIRAPTLVVVGDGDVPHILTTADRLAAGIPGARRVSMSGVAHMLTMEQPEEFNRFVLDFLGEQSGLEAGD